MLAICELAARLPLDRQRTRAAGPELTGMAGRLERANRNFFETFPLFAAAVLIADAAGRTGSIVFWGCQLYFWGRLIDLPLYALGIPLIGSLIWNVATAGIILILIALL